MTIMERVMKMWTSPRKNWTSPRNGEVERYRRYHEAKRKIPMDLPPKEYEAEVKRLAKKYKI